MLKLCRYRLWLKDPLFANEWKVKHTKHIINAQAIGITYFHEPRDSCKTVFLARTQKHVVIELNKLLHCVYPL